MDVLLHKAKLGKKSHDKEGKQLPGWNNVIKHQAGEAAAMRVLGRALQLPAEQITAQEIVAFVHNATKHIQVVPAHFTPEEREELNKELGGILSKVDPQGNLVITTNEDFFDKLMTQTPGATIDDKLRNTPQPELLQYYIDCIFLGGSIVSARSRIDETEKAQMRRGKNMSDDPVRTERLGMKYWEAERLVSEKVQELIYKWLKEQGVDIGSPEKLPGFLQQKIGQEMVEHWLGVHGRENVQVLREKERGAGIDVDVICETKRMKEGGQPAPERNEDTGIIRQRGKIAVAGVFDGATNIGAPLPISPGKAAAVTCREAVANAPLDASPKQILLSANAMLRGVASGLPLTPEQRSELLSAVGAVARVDWRKKTLDFASAGDCHIVIMHKNRMSSWLTKNSAAPFEKLEIAAAVWCAQHSGEPLKEDTELLQNLEKVLALKAEDRPALKNPLDDSRVTEVIAHNRNLENDTKGKGYPSLKGSDDAALERYIQEGYLQLEDGDEVFLFSDGGFPGPLDTPEQRQEVMAALRRGGIEELRKWVRETQDADPLLRDPPRLKQYDDFIAVRLGMNDV